MTAALEGDEWSALCPGRTLPPGKTQYPFYRRLGGPQGRSGWAENLIPIRIRSRTVQPIVSRYTDWATWPTKKLSYFHEIHNNNRKYLKVSLYRHRKAQTGTDIKLGIHRHHKNPPTLMFHHKTCKYILNSLMYLYRNKIRISTSRHNTMSVWQNLQEMRKCYHYSKQINPVPAFSDNGLKCICFSGQTSQINTNPGSITRWTIETTSQNKHCLCTQYDVISLLSMIQTLFLDLAQQPCFNFNPHTIKWAR